MCGRANEDQWLLSELFLAVVLEVDNLTVLYPERGCLFVKHISKLLSCACLTSEIDAKGWQIAWSGQ